MSYCPFEHWLGTGARRRARGAAGAHRGAQTGTMSTATGAGARGSRRRGARQQAQGRAAAGSGARGSRRGARGSRCGLGVPVRTLGVLDESVGLVWVFGAPDSL